MMLAAKLGDIESDLIQGAEDIFEYLYSMAIELFKTNPKTWAEGIGIWSVINQIYESIIPVGCSLVVVFFLIGFCSNTVDVKEELNFERAIRLLIRLGITEWFVVNSLTITGYLFSMASGLIGLIIGSDNVSSVYSVGAGDCLHYMSNTSRVIMIFVVIFYLVILPVSAAAILGMALIRLFKVMLIIPFGPIAYSTIAGGIQAISGTLPSYVKYLLGTLLEAFSIMVALRLGGLLISKNTLFDLNSLSQSFLEQEIYIVPCIFSLAQAMISAIFLTLLVKTAKDVATKALGLIQ